MNKNYPSKDLQYILNRYKLKPGLTALDIGCGDGYDSVFLLDNAFRVTAVDFRKKIDNKLLFNSNFTFQKTKIENFEFDKYDLINAQWVLPFIQKNKFEKTVQKIIKSINQGGFFAGQFFGLEDEWYKSKKDITFISKQKAIKLLARLDIIKFAEIKLKGFTYNKQPKLWHYFEFICRKG